MSSKNYGKLTMLFLLFAFFSGTAFAVTLTDLNLLPSTAFQGEEITAIGAIDYNAILDTNSRFLGASFGTYQAGWVGCQDFNLNHSVTVSSFEYRMQIYAEPACGRLKLFLFEVENVDGKIRQLIARSNPDLNISSDSNFTYKTGLGIFAYYRRCDWNFNNFWTPNLSGLTEINLSPGTKYSLCFYRDYNAPPSASNYISSTDSNLLGQAHIFTVYNYDQIKDYNLPEYFNGTDANTDDIFLQIYAKEAQGYGFKLECGDSNTNFNLCQSSEFDYSPLSCSFNNPFDSNITQGYSDNTVFCRAFDQNLNNSNVMVELLRTNSPLSDFLSCEPVSNSSCSVDTNVVNAIQPDKFKLSDFKLINGSSLSWDAPIRLVNDEIGFKSYYVSTSSDGLTYAFNDSLTFGSSGSSEGVQKIWDSNAEEWIYEILDYLVPGSKYYRLDFKPPIYYVDTFSNTDDWVVSGNIERIYQDGRFLDEIVVSNNGEIEITSRESLPILTNNSSKNDLYVIRFTAWAEEGTTQLIVNNTAITLTADPKTYSFSVDGNVSIISSTSSFAKIYLEQFTVEQRGYFSKDLEVVDEFGEPLPVFASSYSASNVYQFLREGQKFRIRTSAYDRGIGGDKRLEYFRIKVYLQEAADANLVMQKTIEVTDPDESEEFYYEVHELDELVNGFVVTSAGLPRIIPLFFIVQACDADLVCYSEQQTKRIRLHQFPFDQRDLSLNLQISRSDLGLGLKPKGKILLSTTNPNALQFVRIAFWDSDVVGRSVTQSDHNKFFYKGTDFECDVLGNCSFDFAITDWFFYSLSDFYIQLTAKFSSNDIDYTDDILNRKYLVRINAKDWGSVRSLYLAYDRNTPRTYAGFDQIPVVFAVNTKLNESTLNDVNAYLNIWDLGTSDFNAGGDAENTVEAVNYPYEFYYFDENGINYYGWYLRFYEDGGDLTNGHYYRLVANIQDVSFRYFNLAKTTLSMAKSTGGYTSATDGSQQSNEVSIYVDDTYVTTAPRALTGMGCLDTNNFDFAEKYGLLGATYGIIDNIGNFAFGKVRIVSSVKNVLLPRSCVVGYKNEGYFVESAVVTIYNSRSDLSNPDPEFGQYVQFEIPAEKLIFSKKAIDLEEQTLVISKNPGCAIYPSGSYIRTVCAHAYLSSPFINFLKQGVPLGFVLPEFVSPFAFDQVSDVDQNALFFTFSFENLKPMNVQDFVELGVDFKKVPLTKYREYLEKQYNVSFLEWPKTTAKVYMNYSELDVQEINNNLWIDAFWNQTPDQNGLVKTEVEYKVRVDLRYNNGWNSLSPLVKTYREGVIIDRPSKPLLLALIDGWGDFAQDPAGGVMNFFKSPEQVIFFVFLIVIIVFITMILRSWGIANQNSPFARMVFWGVIVIVLLLILLLVGGEAILEMLGLG